jgi:hypothetical protein
MMGRQERMLLSRVATTTVSSWAVRTNARSSIQEDNWYQVRQKLRPQRVRYLRGSCGGCH